MLSLEPNERTRPFTEQHLMKVFPLKGELRNEDMGTKVKNTRTVMLLQRIGPVDP